MKYLVFLILLVGCSLNDTVEDMFKGANYHGCISVSPTVNKQYLGKFIICREDEFEKRTKNGND